MSTKFFYWLRKKDKTSKKSVSCMTGIFQLFDLQFLLSSRQFNGQYHQKRSSVDVPLSLSKQGAHYGKICNLEQNLSRSYQDNSKSSMESSTRTSFSSSSTSCSSLKHRLPKEEPKSSVKSFSSVRSAKNSTKPTSTDINQSPIFRENIKESINKDLKSVSVKEKTEGIKRNKVLKPVDSPRPIDLSKMKELEESLQILIKLRELPRNFHEAGGSPRFSYDGRISTDIKQTITQKEHRRLSLDSMEDSLRRDFKSKVNSLMKELESEASKIHQDFKSNIVAKLMGLEPINSAHVKSNSNSSLVVEETQQKKAVKYAEANMKHKIESAYNVIEKTLQNLEFHHNKKEIRALRRAILETKNSAKTLSPTIKSEKSSISERSLKSASITYAKLEVPSGLRKIKTGDSNDRKKETLSADGGKTPTGKTVKSLNETSRREGDYSISPGLQKRKPDQERKSCAVIPSYDNRKQLESVSPSSRIRQKSSKAQLNEGKSHLFHQTKGKTATNAASASKHKQHKMLPRKAVFVEELERIAPQLSSPNSVLDASPYQDDLSLSPLSVSSISNAEDDNLPSEHHLKIIQLSQNLKYSHIDPKVHKFRFSGSITDNNDDPDNKYVAEALLSSSLLTKDSHFPSMLNQIKLVEPFESVEKSDTQMLQKQLVYDVVNEILTRKIESFNSGYQHDHSLQPNTLSLQLLFKELCFEVKYLQSSIDRSFQDKDKVFTKDLLWRSNGWDKFDSEVPVVVLEIERLIFVDLINEIVSSLIDFVLETK